MAGLGCCPSNSHTADLVQGQTVQWVRDQEDSFLTEGYEREWISSSKRRSCLHNWESSKHEKTTLEGDDSVDLGVDWSHATVAPPKSSRSNNLSTGGARP